MCIRDRPSWTRRTSRRWKTCWPSTRSPIIPPNPLFAWMRNLSRCTLTCERRYRPNRRNWPSKTTSINGAARLTQVRHRIGRKRAKPFRISSGNGRVYTTFAIEFEAFGEADAALVKEGSLVGVGFGDTAETKLAAVGGGKDDVGALQGGKQGDRFHRRQWHVIIDTAGGFFRNHRWPAFQQMLERHPECVAKKCHHDVGFDPRLQLMVQGTDGQLAFQSAKRGLRFGELHVLRGCKKDCVNGHRRDHTKETRWLSTSNSLTNCWRTTRSPKTSLAKTVY